MMTIDKVIVLNYLSTSRFTLVCFPLSFKATSEAVDYNHQLQNFGKCGHRLTKAQCDTYSESKTSNPSTDVDDASKPQGCYVNKASNVYKFNSNAANPDCSSTDLCICKYVGIAVCQSVF